MSWTTKISRANCAMPDLLVVNASPLVFLGNAGRLEVLRQVGATRILVPEPVYGEVTHEGHADRAAQVVAQATWIERLPPPEVPARLVAWDLGQGESAVIATALQYPNAAAVIDDLAGRRCALALGLPVVGTIGLVIAAHRRGHVTDPRALILELRAHGMWLADSVIERALRLVTDVD